MGTVSEGIKGKIKIAMYFVFLGIFALVGLAWFFFWLVDSKELATYCMYAELFLGIIGGLGMSIFANPENKKNKWEYVFEYVGYVFVAFTTGWLGYQVVKNPESFAIFSILGLWIQTSIKGLHKNLEKIAEIVDKKQDSLFVSKPVEESDNFNLGSSKFTVRIRLNYFNILSYCFPNDYEQIFKNGVSETLNLQSERGFEFFQFNDYVSGLNFSVNGQTNSISTEEMQMSKILVLEQKWYEENKRKYKDFLYSERAIMEENNGIVNALANDFSILICDKYFEFGNRIVVSIPSEQLAKFILEIKVRLDGGHSSSAIAAFPQKIQELLDMHELRNASLKESGYESQSQKIAEYHEWTARKIDLSGMDGLLFFGEIGNKDEFYRFEHRFYDLLIKVDVNALMQPEKVVGQKMKKPSIWKGMYPNKFGEVIKIWPNWNKPYFQEGIELENSLTEKKIQM